MNSAMRETFITIQLSQLTAQQMTSKIVYLFHNHDFKITNPKCKQTRFHWKILRRAQSNWMNRVLDIPKISSITLQSHHKLAQSQKVVLVKKTKEREVVVVHLYFKSSWIDLLVSLSILEVKVTPVSCETKVRRWKFRKCKIPCNRFMG